MVEVGDYVAISEEGVDKIANGLWIKADNPYLVLQVSIDGGFMIQSMDGKFKTTILKKEFKFVRLLF